MNSHLKFRLPDEYNKHQFIDNLSTLHAISQESTEADSFFIYDTFDWRLFNKAQILIKSEDNLLLKSLSHGKVLQRTTVKATPTFIWDFPDCPLKEELKPTIKMRALMELAKVHSQLTGYRVLNQDKKTVARLVVEEIKSSRANNAPISTAFLWLKPVRGYTSRFEQLKNQLAAMGLSPAKEDEVYFKALEAAGKKPGDYSAKISLQLAPEMQADEATKEIFALSAKGDGGTTKSTSKRTSTRNFCTISGWRFAGHGPC